MSTGPSFRPFLRRFARSTSWPHTTCPTCEGTGKEPDPATCHICHRPLDEPGEEYCSAAHPLPNPAKRREESNLEESGDKTNG